MLPSSLPCGAWRGAMKRSRADKIGALLVLAVAGGLLSAPNAQTGGDALNARQQELRELKREMEENRRRIEELRRQERSLDDLEERIRKDRQMTARYIAELENQERALLEDLEERTTLLDTRSTEHERMAEKLARRLRLYQRRRTPTTAEILLSSADFSELFARGALLARAIRRDREDLLWLQESREELARETALLQARRRGLESLQEEKRRERTRLDAESDRARREREEIRRERTRFERRQLELAESEKKIQELIQRLEEARREGAVGGPGLADLRGRLRWPVEGEVIERFGVHVHPRFQTKVSNRGIDIAAPGGSPVVSVGDGTVAFVDWLSGYGRCVIVNHGADTYTLYAHCRRVLVGKGARVTAGEQIAEVGDTDSVKGNCLHFEIRLRSEAVDPMEWLR
ncbi:MAG: peptidoglycan DD-metalloendopeptidase family protein [Candidatus Eisenbacteria bacterium]|nr:peptidoglycan DD-metalloendopeptidase family protein [Candidatus Latescibacterota bacterium]MBD3301556.1 peptidoglycan DD-metalloendopeptidase family protein [Candidatus Eisenbacteria bacterium]